MDGTHTILLLLLLHQLFVTQAALSKLANFAHIIRSFGFLFMSCLCLGHFLKSVACALFQDQINHCLSECCQILICSAVSMCTEELNALVISTLKFVEMQQFAIA